MIEQENDTSCEITAKLHTIRLLLLDKLMRFVPNLTNVPGVLTIPFMQVCFPFFIFRLIYNFEFKNLLNLK